MKIKIGAPEQEVDAQMGCREPLAPSNSGGLVVRWVWIGRRDPL